VNVPNVPNVTCVVYAPVVSVLKSSRDPHLSVTLTVSDADVPLLLVTFNSNVKTSLGYVTVGATKVGVAVVAPESVTGVPATWDHW